MIEISVRSEVWCASNGSVSVLRGDTIIDKFDVPEVGKAPLSAGACIASGVWVARGDLAYLYLYHVHTKTMIQTYDLSKAAFEVQRVHSSFGISSLTTIGMLLILPVIRDHFRSFESTCSHIKSTKSKSPYRWNNFWYYNRFAPSKVASFNSKYCRSGKSGHSRAHRTCSIHIDRPTTIHGPDGHKS